MSIALAVSNIYALTLTSDETPIQAITIAKAFGYGLFHVGFALLCVVALQGGRVSRAILEIYLTLNAVLIIWERLPEVYRVGMFTSDALRLLPFLLWAYLAYVLRKEEWRERDA